MSETDRRQRFFVWLDRLFWLVWLAFPVLVWMTYDSLSDPSALQEQLPELGAECAGKVPQVANFSFAGKAVTFAYFSFQYIVYAVLLGFAHVTIHRCATGNVFVANTLKTFGILGAIIVAWPFADLAAANLANYAVHLTGDLQVFTPAYMFDVGPFGIGLLLLTMRTVLEHAIMLKHDSDLTI